MSAAGLVLFDIDGTLIRRAGPQHGAALVLAVREVTGLETTIEGIPVQGMLDRDIVVTMLRNAGMGERAAKSALPEVFRAAQRLYDGTCPPLRGRVCPGARGALRRLQRAGYVAALVTGNLSEIAWRKMESAGLREFFPFGAFAEMGRTRGALARIARQQALRDGHVGRHAPVTLIGDHPNDIRAARENGFRSIAVATGLVGEEELRQHEPDLLLRDLREFRIEHVRK